jgi:hypothetical protein
MDVDPQVADMIEEHYASPRTTELSREDVVRLRIVTTQQVRARRPDGVLTSASGLAPENSNAAHPR